MLIFFLAFFVTFVLFVALFSVIGEEKKGKKKLEQNILWCHKNWCSFLKTESVKCYLDLYLPIIFDVSIFECVISSEMKEWKSEQQHIKWPVKPRKKKWEHDWMKWPKWFIWRFWLLLFLFILFQQAHLA